MKVGEIWKRVNFYEEYKVIITKVTDEFIIFEFVETEMFSRAKPDNFRNSPETFVARFRKVSSLEKSLE